MATTEEDSRCFASTYCALVKDATDNCLPERTNYSALESSKKYTHTGSSNPEVLYSVRNVNSVKVGHCEIWYVEEN